MSENSRQVSYRQGDITLVHIADNFVAPDNTPQKKPNKKGQMVLAEGEVTGHAHVMDKDVAKLFSPTSYPSTQQLLVVTEATVNRGDFIEGKVLETMPGGTVRFKGTDGVVIRFHPSDIEIQPNGVKVNRAYAPLTHDEHDAIPVSPGTYKVIQQSTMQTHRMTVAD